MAHNFLPCHRDQVMLLPPDVRDWVPGDHLAWFVIDVVAGLNLQAFYAGYRADGHGRAAYDPAMMVALLLFNYAEGERSSRVIERRCVENVACRVVAANLQPDHVTISRFRRRHAAALAGLFDEMLVLCDRAGLVKVGTIAIDGTKLRANAGLSANRGYRAIAEEILAEADRVDAEEDARFGERRGDELPAEWADPRSRRARLEEAKRQLDAEREQGRQAARAHYEQLVARRAAQEARTGKRIAGAPPKPPEKRAPRAANRVERRNVTDPDSRIVQERGALIQGYNAQIAVGAHRVILATDVTSSPNDGGQLGPVADQALSRLAQIAPTERPHTVLADGGYWNHAMIAELSQQGIEVLVPPGGPNTQPGGSRRPRQGPEADRITHTLATESGKRRYRQRAALVEPVFAEIKHTRQITRFLRRGLQAVRDEFALIATTHNLRRLHFQALAT